MADVEVEAQMGLLETFALASEGFRNANLLILVRACWALPEREFQYYACEALARRAEALTRSALLSVAGAPRH